jgi:hypothetical protein
MAADLLKVWRDGPALAEAWFYLAPLEQWTRFDYPEATRRPPKEALDWNAEDWADADADERADLQKAVSAQFQVRSPVASRTAQIEMKAWLLSALRSGGLIGIGRPGDPEGHTDLEVVPPFLFDPRHVDWERSGLNDGERTFTFIRVVKPNTSSPAQTIEQPKRKRGRPTNRDNIDIAIEQLLKNGVTVDVMRRPDAVTTIQSYLADEMGVDLSAGYEPSTIQKKLTAKCDTRNQAIINRSKKSENPAL